MAVPLIEYSDWFTAAIAFGFTTGFGILTAWELTKQTLRARNPLRSVYIWLCWVELLICFVLSLILLFMLGGVLQVNLTLLIAIMVLWAFKLQIVIQIICNRVGLILTTRKKARQLVLLMLFIVFILNIMGFTTWIPAQLNIEPYPKVNFVVERVLKCMYLVVDCGLNFFFVRMVKRRLVERGLNKYDKIVRFNIRIIFISIGMDLLIIGTMNMSNPLVYTQFHPLGFMVKLRIELALAELIRKIATQRSNEIMGSSSNEISLSHRDRGGGEGRYNNPVSTTTDISGPDASNKKRNATVDDDGSSLGSLSGDNNGIMVRTMVDVEVGSAPASMESSQKNHAKEDDVEPLNASWKR